MKLKFLYDIDKDVENVIKSTESINNQQPTKFQNFYVQKYGAGFEGEKIKSLIKKQDKENGLDVEKEIAEILKVNIPIFRVEAACASGGAAFNLAKNYLEAISKSYTCYSIYLQCLVIIEIVLHSLQ